MDKILFSTFFALLAGFIAAAMSFVKLVNDKESRITDYREEWTNSVRKSLADVVAHINSISALLASKSSTAVLLVKFSNTLASQQGTDAERKIYQQKFDHQTACLENIKNEIINVQKEMNQTYNFARLHFKQDDHAFSVIEGKFDNVRTLLNELSDSETGKEKIAEIRGKLDLYCNDIIVASRGIMKVEWERIKKGELTYQKTKNVAKWGGVVLLFVLFTIGVHATISSYHGHTSILTIAPQGECDLKQKSCVNNGNSGTGKNYNLNELNAPKSEPH